MKEIAINLMNYSERMVSSSGKAPFMKVLEKPDPQKSGFRIRVCLSRDYDPRVNPWQFHELFSHLINEGWEIHIQRNSRKNMRHFNVSATLVDPRAHVFHAWGTDPQRAISNAAQKAAEFINN